MSYKQWTVIQEPQGFPEVGKDVKLEVKDKPQVTKENQVLVKITHCSLDPFLRGTMNKESYGQVLPYPRNMTAFAAGVVEESKHPDFKEGDNVTGLMSLAEYFLYDPEKSRPLHKIPEGVSHSLTLGAFGMPGATAYFGTLDILKPESGKTFAVSAASGAVGSLVAQIAKIKGCRVVGFAGGKEKCDYVKSLGADECIDYKGKSGQELTQLVKDAAPDGVDYYFDNTGGPCSEAVINNMNTHGKISVCGQIAYYNETPDELKAHQSVPLLLLALKKQLMIQGFMVGRWPDWSIAFKELGAWFKEGKIQVKEDIREGIDNAMDSLMSLYHNSSAKSINFGKVVLKL